MNSPADYMHPEFGPWPWTVDGDGPRPDEANPTWAPADLSAVLSGEAEQPEPSVGLARSDGLRLLYPGKEHTVIGEMESGKSWFCIACAAAELLAGNHVVYIHFEEGDPSGTVERLVLLGVPGEVILERFHFVAPNARVTADRMEVLTRFRPSLTVNDGVNEAMSMHGMLVREEEGASAYRRCLVRPFTGIGSAVLSADHVVKDRDKRGRGPLGSIHKGNGLTGSLVLLENAEPFGRGERGRSRVYVTKDRPGFLRQHGKASKTPGQTFIGELVVDDSWRTPELTLNFWAPRDDSPASPVAPTDDDRVLHAVEAVIATGHDANVSYVRAKCTGMRAGRVSETLDRLVLDGKLTEGAGARNARIFTLSQDHSPSTSSAPP